MRKDLPSTSLTPAEAERLLDVLQNLDVGDEALGLAADDVSRLNRTVKAIADATYDFWDNPADFRRLLGRAGA